MARWGFPSITHRARRCALGAHWQGQTQILATPAPCPVLTPLPDSVFGLVSLKHFQWCHVIYLEKSAQSLIVQPVELSSSDFSQHQHTFHKQSQTLKRSQRATHVHGLASARATSRVQTERSVPATCVLCKRSGHHSGREGGREHRKPAGGCGCPHF